MNEIKLKILETTSEQRSIDSSFNIIGSSLASFHLNSFLPIYAEKIPTSAGQFETYKVAGGK